WSQTSSSGTSRRSSTVGRRSAAPAAVGINAVGVAPNLSLGMACTPPQVLAIIQFIKSILPQVRGRPQAGCNGGLSGQVWVGQVRNGDWVVMSHAGGAMVTPASCTKVSGNPWFRPGRHTIIPN